LHGADPITTEQDELKHRRVEQELIRAQAELEQFAAVVSHDLRSPLLAISGCAQLVREQFADALGGDGAELLEMIQDGVNRMALLIKDLLALARCTPAQAVVAPIEAEQALVQSLAELREPIAQCGATVTHDRLPVIRGNAAQLTQVFSQLIGNALKYHRDEPPCVHVSAMDRGAEWEFAVRDNGIGILPAYFEKIFGIFHRLHDEREYGGGSGIGLPICKKIVEHHGGKMRIESQPGQGSTFFFTLPKPG
jgi:two-component system, chemotaxis family, sensor kinase Cph1